MNAVPHIGEGVGVIPIPSETFARRTLRNRIAAAIESMIALLDALDADADLEDDGTAEPALGWSHTMAIGSADDREDASAPEMLP